MEYQITNLFENPGHIPRVAQWIYDEFWNDQDVHTPDSLADLLRLAKHSNEVPLSLLGLVSGEPVATVNLVENDDDLRPHLRPWLAALFVLPEYRGRGLGSAIVRALQQRAMEIDISEMYLGTDAPRFYKRLGATVHAQLTHGFCVMRLPSCVK